MLLRRLLRPTTVRRVAEQISVSWWWEGNEDESNWCDNRLLHSPINAYDVYQMYHLWVRKMNEVNILQRMVCQDSSHLRHTNRYGRSIKDILSRPWIAICQMYGRTRLLMNFTLNWANDLNTFTSTTWQQWRISITFSGIRYLRARQQFLTVCWKRLKTSSPVWINWNHRCWRLVIRCLAMVLCGCSKTKRQELLEQALQASYEFYARTMPDHLMRKHGVWNRRAQQIESALIVMLTQVIVMEEYRPTPWMAYLFCVWMFGNICGFLIMECWENQDISVPGGRE